jgi:hypothetical protein
MINVTEQGEPEGCWARQNYGKREKFLKVCKENIQEATTEKDRTIDGVITRRDGTKRRVHPIKINSSETMKQ